MRVEIPRGRGPALVFDGELLAWVSSKDTSQGLKKRWTELMVYKTDSGSVVAVSIGRSECPSEIDKVKFKVVEKLEMVKTFYRTSRLSQTLFKVLGIAESLPRAESGPRGPQKANQEK